RRFMGARLVVSVVLLVLVRIVIVIVIVIVIIVVVAATRRAQLLVAVARARRAVRTLCAIIAILVLAILAVLVLAIFVLFVLRIAVRRQSARNLGDRLFPRAGDVAERVADRRGVLDAHGEPVADARDDRAVERDHEAGRDADLHLVAGPTFGAAE